MEVAKYFRARYLRDQLNYLHTELFDIVVASSTTPPRFSVKYYETLTNRVFTLRTHAHTEIGDDSITDSLFLSLLLRASNIEVHFRKKWLDLNKTHNDKPFCECSSVTVSTSYTR